MNKIKEFYKKFTNTNRLVIILIVGIGLLILPDMVKTGSKESAAPAKADTDIFEYEKDTEKRLEKMLSSIDGAEDVSVMITFSDCGKNVYLSEEQSEKGSDVERDNKKPALKNDTGGGESPVLIKKELPAVLGVLITAKGAENPIVAERLYSAASAALGVKIGKISVLPK